MQRRVSLVALISAAAPALLFGAEAVEAQSLDGELNACLWVEDEKERLACFESVARRNRAGAYDQSETRHDTEGAPDREAAAERRPPPPQTGEEERFGLPPQRSKAVEEADRHPMVVAEARRALRGEWVLTMQNGQIWRQTDSAPMPEIEAGVDVEIRKGFFGSYFVKVGNRAFRAKRER